MYKNIICGIYSIENTVNHKKYIGQSVNIKYRWYHHKANLNNGSHNNDYLQKSWNKYGEKNFYFKILEECSKDDLNIKEKYYIDFYDTLNKDCGYNLKTGGQDSNCVNSYVKAKISNANKKYYAENPKARVKKSADAYKQWSNPQIKAKILGKNNGMYGKTHSIEARKKIGEAQKGRISKNRNTTPVLCVELNEIYQDAITACKKLGLKPTSTGSIFAVCRNERKTCGGYHWKFINNMENNI